MNVDELQSDVQIVLDSIKPCVDVTSDYAWEPSNGYLELIFRSILISQYDALDTISHLVGAGRGYAAPPILRPACEEVIWLKYLTAISKEDANHLLTLMTKLEIDDSLIAQDDYAGKKVTRGLGLESYLRGVGKRRKILRNNVRELGKKLNWPRHSVQNGEIPKLKWLAKETEHIEIYNFLYHATSRFVHYSSAELLRRTWGKPGQVSIRSIHFQDYWGAFALYWGLRLLFDAVIEICDKTDVPITELNTDELFAASERIGEHGAIPIITAEELAWPT